MGKTVAKTRNHAARQMAEDIATRCDAKRQLTDQATNDGIAGSQKLDRCLGNQDELKIRLQSIHSFPLALMVISATGVPATPRPSARLRRFSTSSSRPSPLENHFPAYEQRCRQ